MTTTTRRNQSTAATKALSEQIDSAILWITLGVLFAVPLIFSFSGFLAVFGELKLVTLHLGAGLIAILWLWQSAVSRVNKASSNQVADTSLDILRWLARNPAHWLITAVSAWLISQIISTLLSPLPAVSLFGADDARSGYNLYDNISLFVIFLSIAIRFRSERNLKLLVFTLISSGTIAAIYGIAQHFGWDPIGDGAGQTRVWSSFSNPLNFGAYMVMTIPATLAMTIPNRNRRYVWLGVLAVIVGLQLTGLWYTGGRGPYVSFVVAILSFGVFAVFIGQIKSLALTGTTLIIGILIAAVIIALPSPQEDIGLRRVISIGDQIAGINDTPSATASGLNARLAIWGSTLDIATSWDTPQNESAFNAALRPVFGLGPDMYVYSYSIAAEPQARNDLVDHTHNYELQLMMEQGLVGLLLFIGVVVLACMTIYKLIKQARTTEHGLDVTAVLILALAPAVLGKLVEMQTGVSRVSELAMTFALFGAIAAIWMLPSSLQAASDSSKSAATISNKSSLSFSLKPTTSAGALILAALIVTAVVVTVLVGWDLRRTTTSRSWIAAISAPTDIERATGWFESQEKAPERPLFSNTLFIELFDAAIDQREQGNDDSSLQLMHTAREVLLNFEKRDPFKRDNQINLFKTEVFLSQWGESEFSQTAVDRSKIIFDLYPAYPSILRIVANDMPFLGRDDLATEYNEIIDASK